MFFFMVMLLLLPRYVRKNSADRNEKWKFYVFTESQSIVLLIMMTNDDKLTKKSFL